MLKTKINSKWTNFTRNEPCYTSRQYYLYPALQAWTTLDWNYLPLPSFISTCSSL